MASPIITMNLFKKKPTFAELLGSDLTQELNALEKFPYAKLLNKRRFNIPDDFLSWIIGKKTDYTGSIIHALEEAADLLPKRSLERKALLQEVERVKAGEVRNRKGMAFNTTFPDWSMYLEAIGDTFLTFTVGEVYLGYTTWASEYEEFHKLALAST